jgi:hypothetical protein
MDPTNTQKISTTPCSWLHPSLALTAAAISIIPHQSIPEATSYINLPTSMVGSSLIGYTNLPTSMVGSSLIGYTNLPTSMVDIYNVIKSFGSSSIGYTNLPISMVDIYNVIKSSTSPIPILSSQNSQGPNISNMNTFSSKNPQE